MKKSTLLVFLLLIFSISCTKTIIKTVVEKDIVYLQTINDTLLKVNYQNENGDIHKFKILKNDTVFRSHRDYADGKLTFDWFDSIYDISASFKNKHIKVGEHKNFDYIQKTAILNVSQKDSDGNKTNYILKRLTQTYQDLKVAGITTSKDNLRFFLSNHTDFMEYEINFYSDSLKIYPEEEYIQTVIYGCCTMTSEYKLFDLEGNYIIHSNDKIAHITTDENHYLISALKTEVFDAPTIVIQDKNKRRQYVSVSNITYNTDYVDHFFLKFKHKSQPETDTEFHSFKKYQLKTLDDLEIWIPFNQKDTLKIPFKNEKAFGVNYPKMKVELVENKQ